MREGRENDVDKESEVNRIYKVVFNRKKGMLVVASELAKTAVKSGTKLVAATVVGGSAVCGRHGTCNRL